MKKRYRCVDQGLGSNVPDVWYDVCVSLRVAPRPHGSLAGQVEYVSVSFDSTLSSCYRCEQRWTNNLVTRINPEKLYCSQDPWSGLRELLWLISLPPIKRVIRGSGRCTSSLSVSYRVNMLFVGSRYQITRVATRGILQVSGRIPKLPHNIVRTETEITFCYQPPITWRSRVMVIRQKRRNRGLDPRLKENRRQNRVREHVFDSLQSVALVFTNEQD